MPTTTDTTILRGGEFLLQPAEPDGVFTPEKLTEEHLLIGRTAEEFVENEVLPKLDQLEQKDWNLARELVKKGADLGLLGVDVPEAYGGLGLDKVTSLVVSERLARSASFGATFGAHANLTIVPLMLFGTDAQKQRYLPRLLSGEIVGAYGLSESGSGSDALGARTKATRQADGSFLLNGEKMWITNGGFADLFVVFAKVDGEQFTAFLVERGYGVKSGKEEHKMGLQGSSTTPLIFQDVRVPAENVLGEVGKGHKVAFNVLNFVLDENIQIHGGNGYVRDYPAERHYRDARVNRIFEGTNEINRLLIPGMLIRRAVKGELPLIPAAKALQDELLGPPSLASMADEGALAGERRAVEAFKKTALMVIGLAMQTYGQKLTDEQEVLMHLADIAIDVYSAESAVLRALAASQAKNRRAALHADAAQVFVNDAALRIDASARQALAAISEGDTLRTMLAALRRVLKVTPINTVAARRRIADETVARAGYPFA